MAKRRSNRSTASTAPGARRNPPPGTGGQPAKPLTPPGKTVVSRPSPSYPAKPDPAKEAERKAAEEAKRKKALAEWRVKQAGIAKVRDAFDGPALKAICEAHESEFEKAFGMEKVLCEQKEPHDYYYYKDNGSNILAVAHLDTVVDHSRRLTGIAECAEGLVVHSGALDDRLGAYIILVLLPVLGIKFDWLLTVGEEKGMSTADFFTPPEGKNYHWMIEFDRGGMDVVMYCYDDKATADLVRDCGAKVGRGSFSDIAYLEHLEIKGFNWGVAYTNYHSTRGYAYLEETFEMVHLFLKFHETNKDEYLPHEKKKPVKSSYGGGSLYGGHSSSSYTSHRGYSGHGGYFGRERIDEDLKQAQIDEWWRTKEDSLKGFIDGIDDEPGLVVTEDLDAETRSILRGMISGFESDVPDVDPEDSVGFGGEDDPDYVGPSLLRDTYGEVIGGLWPADD